MGQAEQREEAVFEAALKLSAAERAAYLDRECASAADLRRRVEVLLGAFERAGGFMKQPATPERTPAEKPGDRIGRYKLLEQIGEGGCGVVYVAEQEEPVRRRVALKVIKLGMDTKQVIARFDAERQALAMMDHPNIAKVHDAGSTDTGRPYFVMELVRGIKITDYCDQNHLPPRERLDLFIQVCRAIQHAHQKGVIHRDIKPSNILVTRHDGVPVPKVIDFGIAKATQGRLTDQTVYTAFEQFIGTPAYMSPEQAEMSGLDIDTRSDIYSLGVLLYELLTGKTPFDAKELLAAGLDEMRRTIREVEPVKPSTRLTQELVAADVSPLKSHGSSEGTVRADSRRLLQEVRGDLDWIVMKCLEKDRTRRYETANGLASDLSRHLSNEPVVARPPSRLYRFEKSVQRNKLAFAAASAVVAALLIGLTVSTAMFFRAQAEKKKAQTEAARSKQVAQFLKDMLNGVHTSVAMGRDTTLLREILDRTAERVDAELTNQPLVEAELCQTIGVVYFEIGPLDKAEAMIRKALAIRRELLGAEHLDVIASLDRLSSVLWRQEKLAEAESVMRQSLELWRKRAGPDSPGVANTLVSLSGILCGEGKLAESESMGRDGVQAMKKLPDDRDISVAWALSILGRTLIAENKLVEAESVLREAVAIERNLPGGGNLRQSEGRRAFGTLLRQAGRLDEAESVLREVLAIHQKVSDLQRSPYLAWTLDELAAVAGAQDRRAEAEGLLRQALAIKQRVFGNAHPDTTGTLNRLVDVLQQEGKEAEAKSLLDGSTNSIVEKQSPAR